MAPFITIKKIDLAICAASDSLSPHPPIPLPASSVPHGTEYGPAYLRFLFFFFLILGLLSSL